MWHANFLYRYGKKHLLASIKNNWSFETISAAMESFDLKFKISDGPEN